MTERLLLEYPHLELDDREFIDWCDIMTQRSCDLSSPILARLYSLAGDMQMARYMTAAPANIWHNCQITGPRLVARARERATEELSALRSIARRIADAEPEAYGSDECFFCGSWTGKHAEDCAYERAVDVVQQFNIR